MRYSVASFLAGAVATSLPLSALADVPRRGPYGGCGEIAARWDAPRGALVLIDSGPNSLIKPIINAIGETYTHEMVAESADAASQSEIRTPGSGTCNYPIDVQALTYGYPGMQRSMNMGAIYADIYGGVAFRDSGSIDIIWHYGDASRANAIADAIQSTPTSDSGVLQTYYDYFLDGTSSTGDHSDQCFFSCPFDPFNCFVFCGDTVHRMYRGGDLSPYSLHQYYDIEGTYLGQSGWALRNGSMSASYCSYAYALGGPPMTPFLYEHDETWNAGWALAGAVYDNCRRGLGWFTSLICGGTGHVCERAVNMVLNCMRLGDCNNNTAVWQGYIDPPDARAWTISPDRLGGHSARFAQEVAAGNPPTTWAADSVEHDLQWNAAGSVYGCYR